MSPKKNKGKKAFPGNADTPGKHPALGAVRKAEKNVHLGEVVNVEDVTPRWRFHRRDKDGPFSCSAIEDKDWCGIIDKLAEYERKTRGEIRQEKQSHPIPVASLSPEARKRLGELPFVDVESLFSFRHTGGQRLWFIENWPDLDLLWWDPKHRVYPSKRQREN